MNSLNWNQQNQYTISDAKIMHENGANYHQGKMLNPAKRFFYALFSAIIFFKTEKFPGITGICIFEV
jgi:hypothetical protein